tara:strand:- start:563121 stop:563525 length:405 start_codon:yes stop_codon:yes gene_type:complete
MNALTKLSATALLIAVPVMAQAATPTEMITCKADQDQAENNIKLERISPEMIRATGTLTAPSPAYKVAMHTRSGDLVLEFIEPNQMAPMMISAIKLDQTMTVPPLNTPIGIKVEKDFNWGPTVFVCEPVMRPDY